MKRLLIILFVAGTLPAISQNLNKQVKELDAYINETMGDWSIPGLAVAVVKDGKVLMAKGYGEKEVGSGNKVDSQTIFNIGSTTKAFTAMVLAQLVDEGTLKWDDKVAEHMPEFQLKDPYISRDMRVRDLLTHNLGMPNTDLLWYYYPYDAEEILYRMRFVEPAYPLRGGYIYQNVMYLAAGRLAEKVSGSSWADLVEDGIFKPLGMANSYANLERSMGQANRSIPHAWVYGEDEITPIPDRNFDKIGPAGTIWSCIDDMSLWIASMLDSSKHQDGRLVSPATWMELFKPHTQVPVEQFYPTARLTTPKWITYSLGWFQHDYNGRGVDFHTGSIDGTIAQIGLIRTEGLGYYFLGNLDHAEIRHALMYKTFDVFGGGADRDWSAELLQLYGSTPERQRESIKTLEEGRIPDTEPSLELEAYVGTYHNEQLGKLEIGLKEGSLIMSYPLETVFEHWHYDTFISVPGRKWDGRSRLQFNLGQDGKVKSLVLFGLAGPEFRKK